MIKIGNVIINETKVTEAHANMEKGYLKVTFESGASAIYKDKVLECNAEYALRMLNSAILDATETNETPEKEKLSVKDIMFMNLVQQGLQPKQ